MPNHKCLSKKQTLPISGQNLFPHLCPLIRDYTAVSYKEVQVKAQIQVKSFFAKSRYTLSVKREVRNPLQLLNFKTIAS